MKMSRRSDSSYSLDTEWSMTSKSHDVCCTVHSVLGCYHHKNGNGEQWSRPSVEQGCLSIGSLLRSSPCVQRLLVASLGHGVLAWSLTQTESWLLAPLLRLMVELEALEKEVEALEVEEALDKVEVEEAQDEVE